MGVSFIPNYLIYHIVRKRSCIIAFRIYLCRLISSKYVSILEMVILLLVTEHEIKDTYIGCLFH